MAKLAFDPPVSEPQRRLMQAAAHTKGGFGGVPQSVGREFVKGDEEEAGITPGTAAPGWYDTTKNQPIVKPPDSRPGRESLYAEAAAPEAPKITPDEDETEEEKEKRKKKAAEAKDCTKRAHDASIALDRDSVRSYDVDGRLHVVTTNISKANICEYTGREIPDYQKLGLDANKTYKLFRDPTELAKAAGSFNNIPLLSRHVPVSADDHQPKIVVGSLGTDAVFDAPYLRNSLVVWAKNAIDDIESGEKVELSSAYRYRADMTPGNFEGKSYDGVMRDINGNHVSLVKEGRAGPDVVVGDSALHTWDFAWDTPGWDWNFTFDCKYGKVKSMKDQHISRKGAMAHGALLAYLAPKLAQDAKIDLAPIVAGKFDKRAIARGLDAAVAGKLAEDANIYDVTHLLDAIDGMAVDEWPNEKDDDEDEKKKKKEEEEKKAKDKKAKGAKDEEKDDDKDDKNKKKDEPKAEDEEETEEEKKKKKEKEAAEAKDKKAKDKAMDAMVTKPAMDEAIAVAVKAATDNQREIRDAERAVRPYVGELAMDHDSAADVYRAALKTLGVKADEIHPSALATILSMQPRPGAEQRRAPSMGMDSKGMKSLYDLCPGLERIKIL
jgi:uncharacterized protein